MSIKKIKIKIKERTKRKAINKILKDLNSWVEQFDVCATENASRGKTMGESY